MASAATYLIPVSFLVGMFLVALVIGRVTVASDRPEATLRIQWLVGAGTFVGLIATSVLYLLLFAARQSFPNGIPVPVTITALLAVGASTWVLAVQYEHARSSRERGLPADGPHAVPVGAMPGPTEVQRDLLSEASLVLASSVDYDSTLSAVARLAVPQVADWCAVDVLEPSGQIRRVAVAHQDPAKVRLAYEIQSKYPSDPNGSRGLPQVLRSGEPELAEDIPAGVIEAAAVDAEHLRILRELELSSYLIVPLVARERIMGALSFVTEAPSGRRLTRSDLAFARQLADRAAIAIDNARLIKEAQAARLEAEAHARVLEEQADELAAQAAEMEQVQSELEMANDELLTSRDELLKRTQQAERAWADAEQLRAEAAAANHAKSDFLASMSHELRTPINAIIGYTDLLSMGIAGPVNQAQQAQLERIRAGGRHLLTLINEVLDLAKVEAGQLTVRREVGDLNDVTAAALSLVEPQAVDRRLEVQNECGPSDGRFLGDEDRVRQILTNLLSNAVKFSSPGDTITLVCGESDEAWSGATSEDQRRWVFVRVVDTGIGIAADQLDRVFEPFVQASEDGRATGGTGLGLTISRRLARLMDGELTADSHEGVGSAFTLWLPAAM